MGSFYFDLRVKVKSDYFLAGQLLDSHELVATHLQVGVLDLVFKKGQGDDFTIICRGEDQISRVEGDALNWRVDLKDLTLEQLLQLDSIEDGDYASIKTDHDVAIIEGAVFESCYTTFQLVEDVNGARLFSGSVVDHYKGARLVISASKDKLFRDYLLILLIDVINSIAPLKPRENCQINRSYTMRSLVQHQSGQIDLSHNSTRFIENNDASIVGKRGQEHL